MNKAFTLVECATCVAIIVVLAGVCLTVLPIAKHSAKSTATIHQLKNLYSTTLIYTSDHNDQLPYAVGNNCHYLAFVEQKRCVDIEGISLHDLKAIAPINGALSGYGLNSADFRSSLDVTPDYFRMYQSYKATWFEQTTTTAYLGSSYEYATEFGLHSIATSSLVSSDAVFESLFTVKRGEKAQRATAFGDGRVIFHGN